MPDTTKIKLTNGVILLNAGKIVLNDECCCDDVCDLDPDDNILVVFSDIVSCSTLQEPPGSCTPVCAEYFNGEHTLVNVSANAWQVSYTLDSPTRIAYVTITRNCPNNFQLSANYVWSGSDYYAFEAVPTVGFFPQIVANANTVYEECWANLGSGHVFGVQGQGVITIAL